MWDANGKKASFYLSQMFKLAKQKSDRDKHCKPHTFVEGQRVYVNNFGKGERWLPGDIVEKS